MDSIGVRRTQTRSTHALQIILRSLVCPLTLRSVFECVCVCVCVCVYVCVCVIVGWDPAPKALCLSPGGMPWGSVQELGGPGSLADGQNAAQAGRGGRGGLGLGLCGGGCGFGGVVLPALTWTLGPLWFYAMVLRYGFTLWLHAMAFTLWPAHGMP